MHRNHDREIKLSKKRLITKIEENKAAHIKDYNEAVEAYKKEAKKQLEKALADLEEGSLKIKIDLVTPVNRTVEYDKVIEMFNWEIKDDIELSQSEFNEYVHDDNQAAITSKFLNSTYKGI